MFRLSGLLVIFFLGFTVVADTPLISDVMVRQRWPWSRQVDIYYTLNIAPGQEMDIHVSGSNFGQPVSIPTASLSGDLYRVQGGLNRIVWNPLDESCADIGTLLQFKINLTALPIPLYMIVDLEAEAGAAGQIEYVYEEALTNGAWGAWERDPITNLSTAVETVIWTGVTTNELYKTSKLVLRRVEPGSFDAWGDNLLTTITRDFYIGVFEVTQRQWQLINKNNPSSFSHPEYYAARPVEVVSYNVIRGTSEQGGAGWPAHSRVDSDSFMDRLRKQSGISTFDLPTEAQWRYACRAGTTTYFNTGGETPANTGSNEQANAAMRYRHNGGWGWYDEIFTEPPAGLRATFGTNAGSNIVGSYLPNAWGLYDMHGNVWEWCLDWHGSYQAGVDPVGVESADERVRCGGSWSDPASSSTTRNKRAAGQSGAYLGLRVVVNCPN